MLHEPASQGEIVDYGTDFKASLGIKLFIFYALVYAGFVAIGLFRIEIYDIVVFAGLNVAVVYGFGLIVFALLLALAYDRVCTRKEAALKAIAENAQNQN